MNRKLSARSVFCLLSSVFCLLTVGACRQDMHNQPKYKPLRPSDLFSDKSSARPLIEGFGERFITTPVGGVGLR